MNYANLPFKNRSRLKELWFNIQVWASLWWLWLIILIVLAVIVFSFLNIVYVFSHPEIIGEWFGRLIKGFQKIN